MEGKDGNESSLDGSGPAKRRQMNRPTLRGKGVVPRETVVMPLPMLPPVRVGHGECFRRHHSRR
jgi:hypothetical protein